MLSSSSCLSARITPGSMNGSNSNRIMFNKSIAKYNRLKPAKTPTLIGKLDVTSEK